MFTLDLNKKGVNALLKPYQIKALQIIIENSPRYTENYEIWEKVNNRLKNGSISRASIINYMNALKDHGYVQAKPTMGKGGKRFAYRLTEIDIHGLLDRLSETLNMATNEAVDELSGLLSIDEAKLRTEEIDQ